MSVVIPSPTSSSSSSNRGGRLSLFIFQGENQTNSVHFTCSRVCVTLGPCVSCPLRVLPAPTFEFSRAHLRQIFKIVSVYAPGLKLWGPAGNTFFMAPPHAGGGGVATLAPPNGHMASAPPPPAAAGPHVAGIAQNGTVYYHQPVRPLKIEHPIQLECIAPARRHETSPTMS